MRRTPFYAYPSFPQSAFYVHPTSSDHHGPRRPFPAASPPAHSPAPAGPRSVINIPVFDSAPASSPPHVASDPSAASLLRRAPTIQDPSSAATAIQAHFRGFRVRRHRPLLHLRSIAKARKQLEDLQAELHSAACAVKVKADEKERLRLNESIMAIILRLDAIEGSMAEVRSQRKEATKMAIKLQDAIDAITVQKDESADDLSMSNDGASSDVLMTREEDPILCEQLEQNPGSSGGSLTPTDNGMREQDEFASAKCVDVVAEGMRHVQSDDIEMDFEEKMGPSLLPSGSADVDQQVKDKCLDPVIQLLEEMDSSELRVKAGNNAGHVDVAEEEVSNGMEGLHLVGLDNSTHDSGDLVAKLNQGNCMDVAHPVDSADGADPPGLYTSSNLDAGKDSKEESSGSAELYPATDQAEYDKPSDIDAAHCSVCQDQSTAERQTDGTCSVDSLDSATLQMNGCENCSQDAYANTCNVENPACDKVKAQLRTPAVRTKPLLEAADSQRLRQLSEDCKQLKLLVGNLLVQNKTKSKVICALTDRLEQLEHQQQLKCQRSQQHMREKRKLKKGSKRSVRCRGNCDYF